MWGAFSVHNTQAKQTEMEAMQKYYEDKLAGMQAAIAELTQQRDALAAAVAAAEGNRHSEAGLAAHADLAERLEHTERQLVDMQGRHRDLSRIAEVKAKMGAEVRARAPPPPTDALSAMVAGSSDAFVWEPWASRAHLLS